jgi:fibronectin type III domain protein/alpha/beta hydrolase family protein DUF900
MKKSQNKLMLSVLTLTAGILAVFVFVLHAQDSATSVQDDTVADTNVDWNSMSDFEVELKALEMTTPMPASELPDSSEWHGFYSVQNLDWPPLPADILGLPVWPLGDGFFALDDTNVNYVELEQSQSAAQSQTAGGVRAMDDSGGDFSPDFTIPTNGLWLQINGVSNGLAYLTLNGTTNGVEYQILSEPSLTNLPPISAWNSEGMFWGSATTNWTAMTISQNGRTNLFFSALSWQDSDDIGIPDWWQLKYFGYVGINPYGDPEGDGWNNLEKFQNGMNPNVFYTPPAPEGVTVDYNVTNGTVTVSWLPSPGPVTSYTVDMNGTDYTVSSDTLSFENNASEDDLFNETDYGDPEIGADFQVQANYAGGSSAESAQVPLESNADSPTAYLVPGPQGAAYLEVPAIPPGTVAIQITRIDVYADSQYNNSSFDTNFDIPISDFTNGLYVWPASLSAMAPIDSYGDNYYIWWVQTVNGNYGPSDPAVLTFGYNNNNSIYYNDYQLLTGTWPVEPYFDGREQLKQNLIFQLRAGLKGRPFQFTEFESGNVFSTFSYPTNYAYAGFYQLSQTQGYYGGFDLFMPFGENYLYENFVFNPSGGYSYGLLNSFTNIYTYDDGGLYLPASPAYQFQAPTTNGTYIAPVLATNETRWLFSYQAWDGDVSEANMSPIGITTSYPTNELASDAQNAFGLQFLSTEIAWSNSSSETFTLYPGDSTTLGQDGWFYSETLQPQFQTVGYDFWNPAVDSLPGATNFSPTNVSQLLITSVGNPSFRVTGYEKLAVQNGYSGVYGYLGQYFTNAYQINTNGVMTTNIVGILSPYGDFFPTNPGPAALVTMPDPDTGAQGTCTVYAVSLALDANHDGIMNTSLGGPDTTSPNQPYVFWCNNNYDRTNYDADDNTNYEDDIGPATIAYLPAYQQVPDYDYVNTFGDRVIPTKRDLEDYARLWVCGITSNLLAALPSGSTITLNWGDVGSPNSANPTIDLFAAADTNGGIGYLTNETIAAVQTNITQCPYIDRLGPGQSIQLNASQFNSGTAYFIWCGVSNGSGGLNLTIANANGTVLGQATAYIQIEDIKQMYERWTVGDDPNVAPTTTPVLAADDLPSTMQLPFQYTPPTGTNMPYILFIHGWNLETWEKDRYAETAFKRLYWQGYQGRFGEFRWPTDNGFTGTFGQLFINPSEKDNFDESEYQAWQSAQGLLNLLNNLNVEYPGQIYMLAHSMGNIVAGEALRLAGTNKVANTYVASQAAVSAHTYDTNVANYSFSYPPYSYHADTPNIYGNWFESDNGGGSGKLISFYNTNDYALSRPYWQLDELLKPDQNVLEGTLFWNYGYNGSTNDPPPWNNFFKQTSDLSITVDFDIVNVLTNRYEVMGYDAQSYTTALGATPVAHNVAGIVNLTTLWPSPDPLGDNYGSHFYHSAEFRGDSVWEWNYWNTLLFSQTLGFNISSP